jgi:hypothetical protein
VLPVTVRVYFPVGVPGLLVTLELPPPPPQPAIAKISSNPAASVTNTAQGRLTRGCRRLRTTQARPERSTASRSDPVRQGESGGAGGSSRERGALIEGAVVVTLTVTFVAELPAVNGFGETVQVASEGAPVQVKATLWLNPPSPATLNV